MPRKKPNVGLIGLGIIGSRVASGLRAAGFPVFVWNRSPLPAPNFLGSPALVAQACEIIQLFVADAQAVFEVIEAMGEALTPDHIIVCNATIGREATLHAAKLVESRGARFLDAPFTGSKLAAEKQQLVYYIGGEQATLLPVRAVLEATSKAIVPIGKIGDAAVVKVVTNMINAVSIQCLGEALAIVSESGLAPEALAEALAHNACRSATMELKLPQMIAGDYEPHFALKHMSKDVQLGLDMARALKLEVPASALSGQFLKESIASGHGDLDFAALYQRFTSRLAPNTDNSAPAKKKTGPPVPAEELGTVAKSGSEADSGQPSPSSLRHRLKGFFARST